MNSPDATYRYKASVVRVVDGDTGLVDPSIYPQDQFLRVRFEGLFSPEKGEKAFEETFNRAREMLQRDFCG